MKEGRKREGRKCRGNVGDEDGVNEIKEKVKDRNVKEQKCRRKRERCTPGEREEGRKKKTKIVKLFYGLVCVRPSSKKKRGVEP